MSGRNRVICGVASVILFGCMIWMLWVGPKFEFAGKSGTSAITVRCEPMLWGWGISWGGTPSANEIGSHRGYDVDGEIPGSVPRAGDQIPEERRIEGVREYRSQFAGYCDRARTGQAGLMAVLAVPASLLAFAAFRRRAD